MTLTARKGVRLNCLKEDPDERRYEAGAGILPCRVLVRRLVEVLRGHNSWTGGVRSNRLRKAETQQQHSYTGP